MQLALWKMLEGDNGHSDPGRWFDSEIKACLGVDVFEEEFRFDPGYVVFEKGAVRVLVLRMEDLNAVMRPALAAFLGVSESRISERRANVGDAKWYGDVLGELKATFRLPPDLAPRIWGTRYVHHFYSAELPRLRERWG